MRDYLRRDPVVLAIRDRSVRVGEVDSAVAKHVPKQGKNPMYDVSISADGSELPSNPTSAESDTASETHDAE